MELILNNYQSISELCQKYNVLELDAFGSFVLGKMKPDSDIDFLVKFGKVNPYNYFDNYLGFKDSLKKLLNREIDLVEVQTLKNPILIRSINRSKKNIYGRTDSQMVV